MKRLIFFCLLFAIGWTYAFSASLFNSKNIYRTIDLVADSLPDVLTKNHADFLESKLRNEAIIKFGTHQLPDSPQDWEKYRANLRKTIIQKTGLIVNHKLPLDIKETGSIQMKGYKIKNIAFQTRPGVYATANLYIPDGKGPFPAVISMPGHWRKAKFDPEGPQQLGHSLALDGYVCLSIDPWGSGERTSVHGAFDYHGASLGASLLNVGESLAGLQISDNIRGVDLLSSLPFVDPENIGATGASGGGNQTMWLAAMDERIKAAVPVVSVGTFESYVMRSNCICELLPDGLTFTEEAGIIALVAPRAIMMCNHKQDSAPAFLPFEMQRTVRNASPVFKMLGVEKNISYQIFDKTHGYWPENREAMLGWFDLHLKGIGTGMPKKESGFELLPEDKLLVYPIGKRDPGVQTTADFCEKRGKELRTAFLNKSNLNVLEKQKELRNVLRINDQSELKKVHQFERLGGWDRFALESSDSKLIPILHLAPADPKLGYMIISNTSGKKGISSELISELKSRGQGIVIVELSGTGETTSTKEIANNKSMVLHTLSRSELWLGKTILGEWVKELNVVSDFLKSNYKSQKLSIDGNKEAGLAALFLAATGGNVDDLILRDAPLSYQFDNSGSLDFFSMAIHLPGFLNWGDVSLAAALSGKRITILNPVTMSGQKINGNSLNEYRAEFAKMRTGLKKQGETVFN
ncbi:MAG: acetylxylan esterase [Daejeonella sp.]|uniref:alpha/beta hydrolase family protein n=1 Tax=Daejeonella sp. TaxID=2805397 RepID=UPI002734AD3D|nr:acetylxylan esterase [Daejeonella sp.]MDP3466809.1 acetylxylan esterase [Daejeonella sp.]